ncbi:MurR/RpiR family transcriptional regulator [Bacillaceae bacterium CLA-AA-H227]|uniref:MurR/RpiR family transcriptional regulator n=1 Tax=Robertmurraya yapensis (ex Hitch et al 2024) TaxID=3133160 RepID=A0ACC6SBP6_9BACI
MYRFWIRLLSFIEHCEDRSSTEANIADFILKNAKVFPDMSIYDVAEQCHTSPASISRFCKRIGDISFKDLKNACIDYNEMIEHEMNIEVSAETASIFSIPVYFDHIIKSLKETEQLVDQSAIQKTLNLIKKSNKIAFFGATYSQIVAKNAQIKFTRLQKYCSSFSTEESQLIEAESLSKNDLAFIISFSGSTKHIQRVSKVLNQKKIKTVILTSDPQAEICKHAEVVLQVSKIKSEHFNSPVIQEYAMHSVINVLYLTYAQQLLNKES